jgi:hypothetical protein
MPELNTVEFNQACDVLFDALNVVIVDAMQAGGPQWAERQRCARRGRAHLVHQEGAEQKIFDKPGGKQQLIDEGKAEKTFTLTMPKPVALAKRATRKRPPTGRPRGGPPHTLWKKGAPSPNPGGRPALFAELREAAQVDGPASIRKLAEIRDIRKRRILRRSPRRTVC